MKKRTSEVNIDDNIGGGPAIQFYILKHGMVQCMKDMMESTGIGNSEKACCVDGMLEILRKEVLREKEGNKMTNFDKFREELNSTDFGVSDGKVISCIELICDECDFRRAKSCKIARMSWLKREYTEPPKISIPYNTHVDAKILVSDNGKDWFRRHYAGCVDGKYYAWNEGRTSWSSNPSNKITWEYMKEYVEPEENIK